MMKINKSCLSGVIAICLSAASPASHAIDVDITTMIFGAPYVAEGQLRDNPGNAGNMNSVDKFFNETWAAVGVAYFEAGNATPLIDSDIATDEAELVAKGVMGGFLTDGVTPRPDNFGALTNHVATGDGTNFTWSGTAGQGAFSYNFTLPANYIAWGTIFNWSINQGIPVLNVMDCTDPLNCTGVPGTPMQVGPFPGQDPLFNGGLPPISCGSGFVATDPDKPVDINVANDVFSLCSNAQGAMVLDSYTQPSSGSVTDNAGVLTYTPNTQFSGSDSFTFTVKDSKNTAVAANFDVQVGGTLLGNFSMLDSNGDVFGGTNDVVFTFNGVDPVTGSGALTDATVTDFTKLTIASKRPQPFKGFVWNAHHIRVFGPGTYTFDTACTAAQYDSGITSCGGSSPLTMTVGSNQLGAHILFDWSSSVDIDVVNVWDKNAAWNRHGKVGNTNKLYLGAAGVTPAEDASWELVSTDVNSDNINGAPMVDGPFFGFYANFSYKPNKGSTADAPVYTGEASNTQLDASILSMNITALFAGLMLLIGLRRV